MKLALYIEDGLEQIILTPSTETDRKILAKLSDGTHKVSIHRGGFYYCQGGWVRETQGGKDSVMIVLTSKKEVTS